MNLLISKSSLFKFFLIILLAYLFLFFKLGNYSLVGKAEAFTCYGPWNSDHTWQSQWWCEDTWSCCGYGTSNCNDFCCATCGGGGGCVDNTGASCNRNVCGGTGTIQCDGSCSAVAPYCPPLSDPTNLSYICDISGNSVNFGWNAVQDAQSYQLRINKEPWADWANLAAGDQVPVPTTNSYTANITPDASYMWSVQAKASNRPDSNIIGNAYVFQCLAPLSTPANLTHTCGTISGATVVTFNWSAVPNAQSYQLRLNKYPWDDWANLAAGDQVPTPTTNSYTATITPAVDYMWSVQAKASGRTDSPIAGNTYVFQCCSPTWGQACSKTSAANACGQTNTTTGTYDCAGTTCSAATPTVPANPAYYGQACSKTSIRNMCGAQNTNYGTYGCNGTNTDSNCSATLPTSPALPAGCTYSWQTGASWGACSAPCGTGNQTRAVWCLRSDGATVADSYCTGTKPASSQACNTQCCLVPGTWGAPLGTCTAACGGGTQTMTCNGASCGGTCSGSGSQSCNPQTCPTCSTVGLMNYYSGAWRSGLITSPTIWPITGQINYAYSNPLGVNSGATCTVTVTGCGATIDTTNVSNPGHTQCYTSGAAGDYRARVDFTPSLNSACTVNFYLTPGTGSCGATSSTACSPAYGSACSKNSSPNSCGKTNITFGTTQCDGVTCNALTPTTPTTCTPTGLAAACGGSATNPTAYLSWGSQAANGATSYNVTVNGTTTPLVAEPPSKTINIIPGAANSWSVAACGTTCSTATVPVPPTFTCGTTITPWIQTTGDVHSNTDINAQGGP